MNVSIKQVRIADAMLWVELNDSRVLGTPLTRFPRLLQASEHERQEFEIFRDGVRWKASGEEIFLMDLFSLSLASDNTDVFEVQAGAAPAGR
ncbi:DUF2442 domain-containing protein [Salmonella enterica subsp. enterica serovar Typhimurium]|nr:DUF2442 domain-containing protein [Salmonella enterica subsp. enterica serovar Typhimurium]EIF3372492.1 DUF2442 domain-containing protein [Salmonella enterica subsp. enterica serovar Typhimurium]EII7205899.1 DUF2442 domain-containing protein [Salmonella enterica subsp. enterica serovar Typhimurium]EIP0078506.1 DUF2442 domain-containing protein [Salmonella enterica subsp. enterica serovar Typhimurium]EIW9444957.1 DUF2442 domain-containing protein [Salmonella enterica subsp. enterica serovar T